MSDSQDPKVAKPRKPRTKKTMATAEMTPEKLEKRRIMLATRGAEPVTIGRLSRILRESKLPVKRVQHSARVELKELTSAWIKRVFKRSMVYAINRCFKRDGEEKMVEKVSKKDGRKRMVSKQPNLRFSDLQNTLVDMGWALVPEDESKFRFIQESCLNPKRKKKTDKKPAKDIDRTFKTRGTIAPSPSCFAISKSRLRRALSDMQASHPTIEGKWLVNQVRGSYLAGMSFLVDLMVRELMNGAAAIAFGEKRKTIMVRDLEAVARVSTSVTRSLNLETSQVVKDRFKTIKKTIKKNNRVAKKKTEKQREAARKRSRSPKKSKKTSKKSNKKSKKEDSDSDSE